MFNTARIPHPGCDSFSHRPSQTDVSARSVLVSIHDWLYTVEVIDANDELLPVQALENRVRSIVSDVDRRLTAGEVAVPVSVLTTDERDRWADVRRQVTWSGSEPLTKSVPRINDISYRSPQVIKQHSTLSTAVSLL